MTILMALLGPVAGRLSARFFAVVGIGAGLMAAGRHLAGGAAAFSTGLSHAMTVVVAMLAGCAVVVAVLGRQRLRGGRPAGDRPVVQQSCNR